MRIICVDDEMLILQLTVSICRELPEKPVVTGFDKAADALKWLEKNQADIALLDINMPDMDGITLAARMKTLCKNIAIIFLTGHSKYAVDAFELHASGYLMKPINSERLAYEIEYAMKNLRNQKAAAQNKSIVVHTFGNFDVFVNEEAVEFRRSRAKELLAYLIDNNGNKVTRADAFSILWEGKMYDRSMQKQLDVVIRSLRSTLESYGIDEIFEMDKGAMRIVPEKIDCDLYRFYDGDIETINNFHGEYMSEYSWASITEAKIDNI